LSNEGMGATAISKLMGISRKSVYNSLENFK
jgi:transposase-like protein